VRPRARLGAALGTLALAALAAGAAAAQEVPYPDPWHPASEAAAEAAVARLGAKRGLAIAGRVLAIAGLESGVAGGGRGIVATVQETRRAMAALGARESALEVVVELPADVLFDFDQADIRPDAAGALAQLATVLRGFPAGSARLEGHTDARGEAAYNQRLSQRRAAAVERWLVEREGIAGARLTTHGYGESRPVASNDDEAGRQRNRRVEVIIRKQ
jgi:outer membrane protein OmpA-like peptidoglycan-associated protein